MHLILEDEIRETIPTETMSLTVRLGASLEPWLNNAQCIYVVHYLATA